MNSIVVDSLFMFIEATNVSTTIRSDEVVSSIPVDNNDKGSVVDTGHIAGIVISVVGGLALLVALVSFSPPPRPPLSMNSILQYAFTSPMCLSPQPPDRFHPLPPVPEAERDKYELR